MIKKIYIFIILFFIGLSTQANAYDCFFDKLKPGVTKKTLEENNVSTDKLSFVELDLLKDEGWN